MRNRKFMAKLIKRKMVLLAPVKTFVGTGGANVLLYADENV
jgi:hypothetical protein